MECFASSFSPVLVADTFPLLEADESTTDDEILQGFPHVIISVLIPAVVSTSSYIKSASLRKWFESWDAAFKNIDPLPFTSVVATDCVGLMATTKCAINRLKKDPCSFLRRWVCGILGGYTSSVVFAFYSLPACCRFRLFGGIKRIFHNVHGVHWTHAHFRKHDD